MSEIASFEYTESMREHFESPRNVLYEPAAEWDEKADGRGAVGSALMGDSLRIWIVVEGPEGGERIGQCRWKSYGSPTHIACTSKLSELITADGGMDLDDALDLSGERLARELGMGKHAANAITAHHALREAIYDYFRSSGQPERVEDRIPQIMCDCYGVTDIEIEEEVKNGAMDWDLMKQQTLCGTGCGACRDLITEYIEELVDEYFY